MKLIRKFITIGHVIGLFVVSSTVLYGQGGNSPYSAIGLGDLQTRGNIINQGMGGAGMALTTPAYGNILNPASLTNNRFTFFDIGFFTELKRITAGDQIQESIGGNISHAALGFPVANNWTMAIGLRPVSSVNYQLDFSERVAGTQNYVQYSYLGEGGINQVFWSHGVRLYKGLSVGLEIAYNFGSVTKQARSELQDLTNDVIATNFDRLTVSEISFMPAVHYTGKISEEMYISVGATLSPKASFGAKTFRALQRRNTSELPVARDTLIDNEKGAIDMPSILNTGIAFGKQFRYTIAADVSWEAWSGFKDFDGDQPLEDAFSARVGVEWIPDATSVSSYLKRIAYRLGGYFERLPYQVGDGQIEETGLTLGLSLPVSRGFSSINLAATYGRRGYNLENQIQENILRIHFGITINDRLWFVRRKIN